MMTVPGIARPPCWRQSATTRLPPANGPCRDRAAWIAQPSLVTSRPSRPRQLDPDQPDGRPPPLRGRARRASPHRRRTLDPGACGTAAVEGGTAKSSSKLVKSARWPSEFVRPWTADGPGASSSTGQRRSAGPRLGAGFPGAARAARGRSTTPTLLLSTVPMLGRAGACEYAAGPCCGEPGLHGGEPAASSSSTVNRAHTWPIGSSSRRWLNQSTHSSAGRARPGHPPM
jgi:hypothetical protein